MVTEGTKTLAQFIEEREITAEVEWADSNPNMADPSPDMRHFVVTLWEMGGQSMRVPFSQGSAHTEEPTAADVLDCLASDAVSVKNESDWLAWARDMGYESIEDAEQARTTYLTIQQQANELHNLLGDEAYEELLWSVERL